MYRCAAVPDNSAMTTIPSEDRYRFLAEHANDVVWTMDAVGRITFVSPSVERVRGFTPAEAMAQTIEQIHPPGSREKPIRYYEYLHAEVAAGRRPGNFRGDLEYHCKDGSRFWTEVIACPIIDAQGQLVEVLGVTRDISTRKRAEMERMRENEALEARVRVRTLEIEHLNGQLAQRAELAESAVRARDVFLRNISHDLRTPLNHILGASQVLRSEVHDESQRVWLDMLVRSSREMFDLVTELIEVAERESRTADTADS